MGKHLHQKLEKEDGVADVVEHLEDLLGVKSCHTSGDTSVQRDGVADDVENLEDLPAAERFERRHKWGCICARSVGKLGRPAKPRRELYPQGI